MEAHIYSIFLCFLNHDILKSLSKLSTLLVMYVPYSQGEPAVLRKCLGETAKDLVHND